jgi:hypothetical protein
VAGTAQYGGRMAAPARMGTGAEPDPEAPLDAVPLDAVPLDAGVPLADAEVTLTAVELTVSQQDPAAQAAPELPDAEFPGPDFSGPEFTGPGFPGPEFPDAELPGPGYPDADYPDAGFSDAEFAEPGLPARRRTGVLAVIVAIVVILAAAAAVFAVVTHAFKPKTKVAYQLPAVFKLQTGDCFNPGQNDLAVTVLPCASSHDSEVFATFSLTGSSWPGTAAVQARAQAGCTDRIAGYMNPELAATSFDQEYVYPDQLAWRAGVRSVICEVRSADGPMTGSVRSSS